MTEDRRLTLYDGRERLGGILVQGSTFIASDATGKPLGEHKTQKAACAAIVAGGGAPKAKQRRRRKAGSDG